MKNNVFSLFLGVLLLWVLPLSAHAEQLVQFSSSKDREVITLNLPSTSSYKVFFVPDPDRLVVDVPGVTGKHSVALPKNYKGKLIKAARFGWFDKKTSRFVFDLTRSVHVVEKTVKGNKLVIAISAGEEKVAPTKLATASGVLKAPGAKVDKVEKPVQPTKPTQPQPPGKQPAKAQIPLIVIDAGHGGVDPGTIGPGGTQEKDVVLQYAKALKTALDRTGKYRAQLTRSDDNFIKLRGRVAIARKAGANLFVSLHADSADDAARGLSVYTVSEQASDKEAEALAARENKSDVIAGMNLADERQDVADILISLAQRETKNNSATFADLLVIALQDKVRLLPNSHRFAGFAVLKAPDIPSVLIEIGFLSHSKEEKMLRSKAYRDKVVAGIVAGIDDYFRKVPVGGDGV